MIFKSEQRKGRAQRPFYASPANTFKMSEALLLGLWKLKKLNKTKVKTNQSKNAMPADESHSPSARLN